MDEADVPGQHYRLIMVSHDLPDMSGTECARQMRQLLQQSHANDENICLPLFYSLQPQVWGERHEESREVGFEFDLLLQRPALQAQIQEVMVKSKVTVSD